MDDGTRKTRDRSVRVRVHVSMCVHVSVYECVCACTRPPSRPLSALLLITLPSQEKAESRCAHRQNYKFYLI